MYSAADIVTRKIAGKGSDKYDYDTAINLTITGPDRFMEVARNIIDHIKVYNSGMSREIQLQKDRGGSKPLTIFWDGDGPASIDIERSDANELVVSTVYDSLEGLVKLLKALPGTSGRIVFEDVFESTDGRLNDVIPIGMKDIDKKDIKIDWEAKKKESAADIVLRKIGNNIKPVLYPPEKKINRYMIPVQDASSLEMDKSPLPVDVIPNNMGINLCNVEYIEWEKLPDGQLLNLNIKFDPYLKEYDIPEGDIDPEKYELSEEEIEKDKKDHKERRDAYQKKMKSEYLTEKEGKEHKESAADIVRRKIADMNRVVSIGGDDIEVGKRNDGVFVDVSRATPIEYVAGKEDAADVIQKLIDGNKKEADITLDIDIGDTILGGRFKNKKIEVEEFGTSDIGQPTVNDRQLLSYRIAKLMPEKKGKKKDDKKVKKKDNKKTPKDNMFKDKKSAADIITKLLT